MNSGALTSLSQRVLVLGPSGCDADIIGALTQAEIVVRVCHDIEHVCRELALGAGALLLGEDALTSHGSTELAAALRDQPWWSDLPLIVTAGQVSDAHAEPIRALQSSASLVVLERPARFAVVVAVEAALRSRKRQYELQDFMRAREARLTTLQLECELRARFASLLAHDVRGPLSAAANAVQILVRRRGQPNNHHELTALIDRNLGRIDEMMNNLLDASSIQAGRPLALSLTDCDLLQITRELADDLNSIHGERVRVQCAGAMYGTWSADELRRAVWNLATNAIKYGEPESPVTIRVEREYGLVRISVHNVGHPLSTADQQRIFDAFERASDDGAGGAVGWGLGLTLVRGCAEAHGGSVSVASHPEDGTTFTIELPIDARPFQRRSERAPPAA